MRLHLESSTLEIAPGGTGTVPITIHNDQDVIAGYEIVVLGADDDWVHIAGDHAAVFPGESSTVSITFTLPARFPAGHRQFGLRIQSTAGVEETQLVPIDLFVSTVEELRLRVDPPTVTGGGRGVFALVVENAGNAPVVSSLHASDDEEALKYRFDPAIMRLEPGATHTVRAQASGGRPWFGVSAPRAISFRADGVTDEPQGRAMFLQRPRISRWMVSLAGLLAAVTVFGVVIRSGLQSVADSSAVDEDLIEAALVDDDDTDGPTLSTNPASVEGVVQSDGGAPLSGVTIELFSANDAETPLAAVSTGADGTYRISGLNAGTYRARAAGAGFATVWFPDSTTHADADDLALELADTRGETDFVLIGQPAAISGQVLAEDPSGAVAVLVRSEGTLDPTVPAEVTRLEVAADGSFTMSDLPSPALYELIIEKSGFSSAQREVQVRPGQTVRGIEIVLTEGNGVVSGVVEGPSGPLGNVTVDISDGSTERRSFTLTTAGNVGQFALRDLPTPGAYTLTVSRPGFSTETLSIVFDDDRTEIEVDVRLSSRLGSIAGRITEIGGDPVGSATITVTGNGVQRVSRSASTGTKGSYLISGLPSPGSYAVTISAPGFSSQTQAVELVTTGTGATRTGIDATLAASTGAVAGVIKNNAGNEIGGVTVSLTDGDAVFTSYSADAAGAPGSYRIDRLPPGVYTATFERSGSNTTALLVTINGGETTPLNVELAAQASISGQITDGATVRAGSVVQIFRVEEFDTTPLAEVTTGTDGRYLFTGLDAPQTYVVAVLLNPDSSTLIASQIVTSVPGTALTGIDIDVSSSADTDG